MVLYISTHGFCDTPTLISLFFNLWCVTGTGHYLPIPMGGRWFLKYLDVTVESISQNIFCSVSQFQKENSVTPYLLSSALYLLSAIFFECPECVLCGALKDSHAHTRFFAENPTILMEVQITNIVTLQKMRMIQNCLKSNHNLVLIMEKIIGVYYSMLGIMNEWTREWFWTESGVPEKFGPTRGCSPKYIVKITTVHRVF